MLALGFVGFFVLFAAWAIATPPFAAPDEQYHVSRASSVMRGHIVPPGNRSFGGGAGVAIEARGVALAAASWRCVQHHLGRTAACAEDTKSDRSSVAVFSGAARYAPAYYVLVGWPTLLVFDGNVVLPMRLLSAAWCAAMLSAALGVAMQVGRGRSIPLGVIAAATPQMAFLAGTVNPNAVEIAGAILAWTSGLAIVADPEAARTSWYRLFALGATSMVLMRQLSPLWLAAILVACIVVAGVPNLRRLRQSRRLYRWILPPLIGTFLQLLWTHAVGTGDVPPGAVRSVPTGFTLPEVIARQPGRWLQYIGNMGWLDIPLPPILAIAWATIWLIMAILSFRRGTRRARLCLTLVAFGVLVTPVALEWPLTHRIGFFWQGRYALPIVVGIPLVAAASQLAAKPRRQQNRRLLQSGLAIATLGVFAGVEMWAFVRSFMRYSSGFDDYSIFGPWQPVLPFFLLAIIVMAAISILVWLIFENRSPPSEKATTVEHCLDPHNKFQSAPPPGSP